MSKKASAGEIWQTLSRLDVSEHTEDRNGLTYLSWAWAWGIMKEHYPDFFINWHGDGENIDHIRRAGGTASVCCSVTIGDVTHTESLAVRDYKHKAIVDPDSAAIENMKKRCLTKCFALFGLGHYIYAGEDLPPGENASSEKNISKAAPKPKPKPKPKAKPKSEMVEPTKENGDAVYVSELQAQLKKLAHRLHDTGEWEPDDDTKKMVKSAMKSDDVSVVKQTLENLTLLAEAAGQLTTDKELF
tara:strand:- start:2072 stop:2803 length:732 start_codon:yes stop_codon:yes gene_type:complete